MARSRCLVAFVVVLLVIAGVGRIPLPSSWTRLAGESRWDAGGDRVVLVATRSDASHSESPSDGPVPALVPERLRLPRAPVYLVPEVAQPTRPDSFRPAPAHGPTWARGPPTHAAPAA